MFRKWATHRLLSGILDWYFYFIVIHWWSDFPWWKYGMFHACSYFSGVIEYLLYTTRCFFFKIGSYDGIVISVVINAFNDSLDFSTLPWFEPPQTLSRFRKCDIVFLYLNWGMLRKEENMHVKIIPKESKDEAYYIWAVIYLQTEHRNLFNRREWDMELNKIV